MKTYILKLMEARSFCFRMGGRSEQYLIPMLLPPKEPDHAEPTGDALHYRYEFPAALPQWLVPRFMVKMLSYIYQNLYWLNGVFLRSANGDMSKPAKPKSKTPPPSAIEPN
jgi:C-terminal of Roc, COR, domain